RAAELQPIVDEIAAATKPVASEDMTLVLRAGKSLWYEGAIIHELIPAGRWDPQPLVDMIRNHGFAMIITFAPGELVMGHGQIARAMVEAYPDVREEAPHRFVRRPAQ
ncbi:MAG TPA: hypothetical protein VE650_08640, partial [Acetobacteraceae bacterium]|nr:hypothetical protein [Acetobacteraceae bacterium]